MQFEIKHRSCKKRVLINSEDVDWYATNSVFSECIGTNQTNPPTSAFLDYCDACGFTASGQVSCPECGGLIEIESCTEGVPLEAWPPVLRSTVAEDIEADKKMRGE